MQEGRILVKLSFLLTHVEERKKIQGKKRKAKISLKEISDEFEYLHFELIFFAICSAGNFSV